MVASIAGTFRPWYAAAWARRKIDSTVAADVDFAVMVTGTSWKEWSSAPWMSRTARFTRTIEHKETPAAVYNTSCPNVGNAAANSAGLVNAPSQGNAAATGLVIGRIDP